MKTQNEELKNEMQQMKAMLPEMMMQVLRNFEEQQEQRQEEQRQEELERREKFYKGYKSLTTPIPMNGVRVIADMSPTSH